MYWIKEQWSFYSYSIYQSIKVLGFYVRTNCLFKHIFQHTSKCNKMGGLFDQNAEYWENPLYGSYLCEHRIQNLKHFSWKTCIKSLKYLDLPLFKYQIVNNSFEKYYMWSTSNHGHLWFIFNLKTCTYIKHIFILFFISRRYCSRTCKNLPFLHFFSIVLHFCNSVTDHNKPTKMSEIA